MTWFDRLIDSLADELGEAPRRLLRAMVDVAGAPSRDAPTLTADKDKTLSILAEAEGAPITADALRRRIKQINDAAGERGKETTGAQPPLRIRSRKTRLVITFSDEGRASRQKEVARDGAVRSTWEDAGHAVVDMEEPHVTSKLAFQVFCSHAWEVDEVESVFDDFVGRLRSALAALPPKWREKFSVTLWSDRPDMHATTERFEHQTDRACRTSAMAIFFLSDRWYHSDACRREAAFFGDVDADGNCRYLRVQLSGTREDGEPSLTAGAVFPEHWMRTYPNLLSLWDRGGAADRDAFVGRVRDEICMALERQLVRPPAPPPARLSLLDRIRGALPGATDLFDKIVLDGSAEEPRSTSMEGEGKAQKLLPLLNDWVSAYDAQNRVYAVLGSFGAGKTTAVQMFAAGMMDRIATDPQAPYPIYLDLRRLVEAFDRRAQVPPPLGQLILRSLNPGFVDGVEPQQLIDVLRTERCVVIFDGLDEVGTRVGPERAAGLYRQLLEVVPTTAWNRDRDAGQADWSQCPTRILVTCRTHFFRDHIEEQSFLADRDRHGHRPRHSSGPVETVYMAPFAPEQIRSFFTKHLGVAEGEMSFRAIGRVGDLSELARKPIMTRYIAELAPDLEADHLDGRSVNAARLYRHLFRRVIERDGDKRPLMAPSDRQDLLEALALHLWQAQTPVLTADDLGRWFDRYATNQPGLRGLLASDLEARQLLHTELRNASLLVREQDDGFRFVHTSFQEYFLACGLLGAFLDGSFAGFDAVPMPSRETRDFILDLVETDDRWQAFHAALDESTMPDRSMDQRALSFSLRRAMAARRPSDRPAFPALPAGADLSGLDLRGVRIAGRPSALFRLRDVSFAGAQLSGTQLRHVAFEQCRFDGTWFGHAQIDACSFVACSGAPAHASAARCLAATADVTSEAALFPSLLFRFGNDRVRPKSERETGHTACRLNLGHGGAVLNAVFDRDGARVLTAGNDGTARIWDARSGAEIARLEGHGDWVRNAVFDRDGARVLTAGHDGAARIWDTATGQAQMCLVGLPTSWAVLDADMNVTRVGPDAWRYVHGITWDGDGAPRVTVPDLAPLESGTPEQHAAAGN